MATVVLTPDAVQDITGLPAPIIARMDRLAERLRHWPDVSAAEALAALEKGLRKWFKEQRVELE